MIYLVSLSPKKSECTWMRPVCTHLHYENSECTAMRDEAIAGVHVRVWHCMRP